MNLDLQALPVGENLGFLRLTLQDFAATRVEERQGKLDGPAGEVDTAFVVFRLQTDVEIPESVGNLKALELFRLLKCHVNGMEIGTFGVGDLRPLIRLSFRLG